MRTWLAIAALALALPAVAQEATTLRFHHFAPRQAAAHTALAAPWAAKLEKDSAGRLRVEVSPALSLGGAPSDLERQVREGEVDIVLTAAAFHPGRFLRTEVFELPFLEGGASAATFALQDYYERHLRDEYRDYEVLLLYAQEPAALHVRRPVRRLEDLKGLKIRAPGRAGGVLLRGAGAVAIGAPPAQLPHLLAQGLLDGYVAPLAAIADYELGKLVRHHVRFDAGLGTSVLAMLMNRASYAALPAPLRALIDAQSRRHLAWYAGKTGSEAEAQGLAAARAAGNELSSLAPAEAARLRAAVAPEIERFLDDLSRHGRFDARALYREAQQLMRKHQ